ncbi:MAG: hypothetical protein FJZ90_15650, partial [Chloroflexi bacterium]|nr:hypothetical protein [Chloroflexota bacterium]
ALTSNAAGRFGGGLYAGGSTVVLASNAISGNRSVDAGGGLYLANSVATLHDNTIASNESSKTGGGGLALRFSEVTLTRNVLSGNVTAGDGGGMSAAFGSAELTGNVVSGNLAYHSGGGLYLGSARALLIGNTVSGNVAHIAGGGLRLAYGEVELRSNLVVDNRAGDAGSGGSGFYIEDCACRLLHTTIARNDGGEGSGIRVAGPSGRVALTNTILVSHTVGITVAAGSAATLEATLWGDGSWANATDWGGEGVVVTGALNIWGPPAFLNGEVGDYHITPDSAARDAGVDAGVTSDIDGHPRPAGLAPDLGADELCYPIFLPLSLRQPLSFALEDGYVATIAPEVTGYQMVVFEGE